MSLSDKDAQLIRLSTLGEATILLAPKDHEFGSGQSRLMMDKGDVFVVDGKGEMISSVVSVEEITKKIRDGEWEIREAFNREGPLALP